MDDFLPDFPKVCEVAHAAGGIVFLPHIYEYPKYLEFQLKNNEKLYKEIITGTDSSINFLRESKNYYINTTEMSINEVFNTSLELINNKV